VKVFAPCMQCLIELGRPSFEPIIGDYFDDGVAYITCSAGHKTAHLIQSSKFEMLLEAGAIALLESFTLEACADFSAALERFYEFALRVMCRAQGISPELFDKMFKEMARQSERQLGAFISLYAIEFGESYKPDTKISNFRNEVIHKGMIPTVDDAKIFCSHIYLVISTLYRKLHDKHADHMTFVMMDGLRKKQALLPEGMKFASNTGTMFFKGTQAGAAADFGAALAVFEEARRLISGSKLEMQALHESLKQRGV
jgi:hypothetical protein